MYRHTQVGWVMIGVFGAILFSLIAAPGGGRRDGTSLALAISAVTLALFCTLTVTIEDDAVEASLGPGLIRKRILLAEITTCRAVRNERWYGWGIRWIGTGW